MMLSIIIFLSFFVVTFSSKVGQSKEDLVDENTIVLKQPTRARNLRANDEIIAVQTDLQLSMGIVNLMDAKTLNSINTNDDYIRMRDKLQTHIAQQKNIINQVITSLPAMKTKLSNNEAELLSIEYNLDSLKNESSTLTEQLEILKRTRDFEKQDFQEKLKDSRALIIGIERTQDNLRRETAGDEDLNQVAVSHIMNIMKTTKESLEATMKHDIQTERQADKNYEDALKKSNQVLDNNKASIEKLSNRKSVLGPETVDLKNKIKTDTFKKSQAEVVMAQAITDLDQLNKKFSHKK